MYRFSPSWKNESLVVGNSEFYPNFISVDFVSSNKLTKNYFMYNEYLCALEVNIKGRG